MYYPYLRGRRHELLAIRRNSGHLSAKNSVLPIIEPVKRKTHDLVAVVSEAVKFNFKISILNNPLVGELVGVRNFLEQPEIAPWIHNNVIPALLIDPTTSVKQVRTFIDIYADDAVIFIHNETHQKEDDIAKIVNSAGIMATNIFSEMNTSAEYRTKFDSISRAQLTDAFRVRLRNADYPEDEYFSDKIWTFKSNGDTGFSDYSIVGREYRDTGGPANAVTIHFVYKHDNTLRIRHFVSDTVDGTADTAGKFLEAVQKLVSFVNKDKFSAQTGGCQEFIRFSRRRHFPGLGAVKELSIRHHLELVSLILK